MEQVSSRASVESALEIRPARTEDRAALEAIAAQTWDGDDYLPRVLDEWLNDPYGGFFVGILSEAVVGVTKITRLGEGEWWFEGLRVSPEFQGRGFARILHHFATNYVRQHGSGVVRFATSSLNEAVCQLASETGFERIASYVSLEADPLEEAPQGLWRLDERDAARVRAWLARSEQPGQAPPSLESEWVFFTLTDERLAERLRAGLVYGWSAHGSGEALAGLAILNPAGDERWPGDPSLRIAYLDAAPKELAPLAWDLRRLAAADGRAHVHVKVPNKPAWLEALHGAGFRQEWEGEIWLFAREVSLTAHADVATDAPPALN